MDTQITRSNLSILLDIDKKVCTLTSDERGEINQILRDYNGWAEDAAQQISELLGVNESTIFDLLTA